MTIDKAKMDGNGECEVRQRRARILGLILLGVCVVMVMTMVCVAKVDATMGSEYRSVNGDGYKSSCGSVSTSSSSYSHGVLLNPSYFSAGSEIDYSFDTTYSDGNPWPAQSIEVFLKYSDSNWLGGPTLGIYNTSSGNYNYYYGGTGSNQNLSSGWIFADPYIDDNTGKVSVLVKVSGGDTVDVSSVGLLFQYYYPTITSTSDNVEYIKPGSTFTVTYNLANPNANGPKNGGIYVYMGLSIFPSDGSTVSDPQHDKYVWLPHGNSQASRDFTVPQGTADGSFDYVTAIWKAKTPNGQMDTQYDRSAVKTKQGIIDGNPPTGLSVSIAGGARYTNTQSLALSLSASDTASGLDAMCFNSDNGAYTSWESYSTSKQWSLPDSDGQHTIGWKVRDHTGNEASTSASITLDRKAPTGLSISINSGSKYASNRVVSLTLSATDLTSGVAGISLSNDGSSYSAYEALTNSKSWSLPDSDGSKTVYLVAKDNAGNVAQVVSASIFLDRQAPIGVLVSVNGGAAYVTTAQVSLTIGATDPNPASGLAYMRFSGDGNTWSDWESFSQSRNCWSLTSDAGGKAGDGAKVIYVQVKDSAGNSAGSSVQVLLDSTAPTPNLDISPSSPIRGQVVKFDGSRSFDADAGWFQSGIDQYSFVIDGVDPGWTASSSWTMQFIVVGDHSVLFKVKDKHGLVASITTSVTVNEDDNDYRLVISSVSPASPKPGDIITLQGTVYFQYDLFGHKDVVIDVGWDAFLSTDKSAVAITDGSGLFTYQTTSPTNAEGLFTIEFVIGKERFIVPVKSTSDSYLSSFRDAVTDLKEFGEFQDYGDPIVKIPFNSAFVLDRNSMDDEMALTYYLAVLNGRIRDQTVDANAYEKGQSVWHERSEKMYDKYLVDVLVLVGEGGICVLTGGIGCAPLIIHLTTVGVEVATEYATSQGVFDVETEKKIDIAAEVGGATISLGMSWKSAKAAIGFLLTIFKAMKDGESMSMKEDQSNDDTDQVRVVVTGIKDLYDLALTFSEFVDKMGSAVHSPADSYMVSPSGNKLGYDFINKVGYEAQIGSYSGKDSEPEAISITDPETGAYQLNVIANQDGKVGIEFNCVQGIKTERNQWNFTMKLLDEVVVTETCFDGKAPIVDYIKYQPSGSKDPGSTKPATNDSGQPSPSGTTTKSENASSQAGGTSSTQPPSTTVPAEPAMTTQPKTTVPPGDTGSSSSKPASQGSTYSPTVTSSGSDEDSSDNTAYVPYTPAPSAPNGEGSAGASSNIPMGWIVALIVSVIVAALVVSMARGRGGGSSRAKISVAQCAPAGRDCQGADLGSAPTKPVVGCRSYVPKGTSTSDARPLRAVAVAQRSIARGPSPADYPRKVAKASAIAVPAKKCIPAPGPVVMCGFSRGRPFLPPDRRLAPQRRDQVTKIVPGRSNLGPVALQGFSRGHMFLPPSHPSRAVRQETGQRAIERCAVCRASGTNHKRKEEIIW